MRGVLWRSFFGLTLIGILGCPESHSEKLEPKSKSGGAIAGPSQPRTISSRPASSIRFEDRHATSGIDHQYDDGRAGDVYSIVESAGGGLAICDIDRDGLLDLIYAGGGSLNLDQKRVVGKQGAVYRGIEPWKFEPITVSARVDMSSHYHHGISTADYDNDGFMDFIVLGLTGLQLFHNQGDGTFVKHEAEIGLHGNFASVSAAWGDLENDGDLDLFVVTYTNWTFDNDPKCFSREGVRDLCGPRDFGGADDLFYRNNGDGTFTNISREIGLKPGGRGLGALAADLDNDRKIDFFASNDEEANFLYHNRDGKLVEIGTRSGTALDDAGSPDGNMGIALGDYNRDGKFDLFITHYETETCGLYKNVGRMNFAHTSRLANITCMGNLFVGWGTAFVDFDLDSDEDLMLVNGHVLRYTGMAPWNQKPVLLENHDGKAFENASSTGGEFFQLERSARGLATGDFDGDGLVDVATANVLQPHALLRNVSERRGNWIRLRLVGVDSNRDAIGAIVSVESRGVTLFRQVFGGGSYASSSDRAIHLGLGKIEEIDRITVRWPSGIDSAVENAMKGTEHLVIEKALAK